MVSEEMYKTAEQVAQRVVDGEKVKENVDASQAAKKAIKDHHAKVHDLLHMLDKPICSANLPPSNHKWA